MSDIPSMFARKLRDWRAQNGRHGRMTQDELAELLGVSVDAIGKWERSASFIRGDLEPRLADRLGWTRQDIVECREDWQARRQPDRAGGYRVLDDAVVAEVYGGSWPAACEASVRMARETLGDLPRGLAANEDVFVPIYDTYRDHWQAVMSGDTMVAKWALPFLLPEDEERFLTGNLIEADLSVDRIRQPILPGTYFGYCPALVIRPGHEAAASLLVSTFIAFLENLARRDIFVHGIGTVTVRPGGAQLCRDLGLTRICGHVLDPGYGIWLLPGRTLPQTIFGRRSPLLGRHYARAFPPDPRS